MKRMLLTIGALAALWLSVGLTGAIAANHSAGRRATVAISGSELGRVLVDGRGRTLYLFERDKHGKSSCTGPCATAWPPLIASGKPLASAGARASLLGTTKRADGRLQVTYNHHPLYTFVKDTREGPDERREPRRLRRRMVRRLVRRSQGREECGQAHRRQRSGANGLRVLAVHQCRRGGPLSRAVLSLADQRRTLHSPTPRP